MVISLSTSEVAIIKLLIDERLNNSNSELEKMERKALYGNILNQLNVESPKPETQPEIREVTKLETHHRSKAEKHSPITSNQILTAKSRLPNEFTAEDIYKLYPVEKEYIHKILSNLKTSGKLERTSSGYKITKPVKENVWALVATASTFPEGSPLLNELAKEFSDFSSNEIRGILVSERTHITALRNLPEGEERLKYLRKTYKAMGGETKVTIGNLLEARK